MGAATVFGLDGQPGIFNTMAKNIESQYYTKDQEALNEFLNPEKASQDAANRRRELKLNDYIQGLATAQIDNDWMNSYSVSDPDGKDGTLTFNKLNDDEKKKVINAINNIGDVEKRKQFVLG